MTETVQRKEDTTIQQPRIDQLTNEIKDTDEDFIQLVALYHDAWVNKNGFKLTPDAVRNKILSFDLSETFVVRDDEGIIRAAINTLPVALAPNKGILQTYPTYQSLEKASALGRRKPLTKPAKPTHRICFSITVENGFKVPGKEKPMSLAEYLLTSLKTITTETKVGYSRFSGVKGKTMEELVKFYIANLGTNSLLNGAVGMHERFNAILGAIANSRRADKGGAGVNAIIIYPDDKAEAKIFERIKQERIAGQYQTETRQIDENGTTATIFTDLPEKTIRALVYTEPEPTGSL